jgi:hypothetical protein
MRNSARLIRFTAFLMTLAVSPWSLAAAGD